MGTDKQLSKNAREFTGSKDTLEFLLGIPQGVYNVREHIHDIQSDCTCDGGPCYFDPKVPSCDNLDKAYESLAAYLQEHGVKAPHE